MKSLVALFVVSLLVGGVLALAIAETAAQLCAHNIIHFC